jgi:iron complex outermembrane receptor protein
VETRLKLQQLFPGVLFASTVSVLLASPAFAQAIQITGVRVSATPSGLDVTLETDSGTIPQVYTTSSDKTLLTEIFNTQLRLPDGQAFRQDNPVAGITAVTVTQLSPNTIQIAVTGTTQVPTVKVSPGRSGLVFSHSIPPTTAQTPSTPAPAVENTQNQPEVKPKPPTATTNEDEVEIVVTGEQDRYLTPDATSGTRTDTPIRDIPASIQVIPKQVIEDQQIIRAEEALRNVSGVTFDNNGEGTGNSISVRGFSRTPILTNGFRQYGFSGRTASEVLPDTATIEQIEVLKGPASILYGETQPGGVINVVTKKPLPNPFFAAEFQAGSYGLLRPSLDISGPLNSDGSVLYRLNAAYEHKEGFRDFDQEFNRLVVAPTVTFKLGSSTDLTVLLEYLDDKQPIDFGRIAVGDRVLETPRNRIFGEPDDFNKNEFLTVGYDLEHRFSDNWKLRNSFRFLDRYTQQRFTTFPFSYDAATGNATRFYGGFEIDVQEYSLQTNLVGKFATGSVKHTLLFGVDLNRTDETQLGTIGFLTPVPLNIFNPVYGVVPRPNFEDIPIAFNQGVETDRLGVYLQDQISLTDNLKLLAGIRYDSVNRKIGNLFTFFNPTNLEINQVDDAFTPRVGIVYQPIPEVSLYGSYSRSFTPNSGTSATGSLLKPEEGEGYEVGIKADLFGGGLSATLAYFDITKQNVATADPNNLFFSIATGEQRSRGVELDAVGRILPGWNIIAAYAYTDGEVTKDNTIPIGNRLVGVPQHSASLWTTYEIQKGGLQGLGFGIGFNYVGDREGDIENTFNLGDYFLANAAVYYRRNNWRVGLNLKNIFDVDYTPGTPYGRNRLEVGEPFTVIGSISVKF